MRLRQLVLAVLMVCLGATWIGASPAQAAPLRAQSVDVYLGGVDLSGYCRTLGYQGAKRIGQHGIGDWRCYNASAEASLSVISACQWQFKPLVAAGYPVTAGTNGDSAGEWKCHATAGSTEFYRSMNLAGFCGSIGYNGAKHTGDNVTGWRCYLNSGATIPLDLHAACTWQHAAKVAVGYTVVAVWESYADSFKINCRGAHA
ncbi:hypothetical protein [Nonomuraea zeae]|uniref:Uncharacterized protein n=1 Tax=Nonomuraea zeae TaxID=1642303 RepID=A0A5S4H3I4_9ACTN|nr:hypothetical protein [Nonomuraea zeae]TMR39828.1 hypothetical protein ETD85_00155 [Nonomuraea zeae]